ncbi:MAG TPA: methyltransferase domain-containing protein [Pyrinomonadaceae bacterium]
MLAVTPSLALRIILWALAALFISGQSARPEQRRSASTPAASATPTPDARIDRPTSEPYTGGLSIFEDPKRAENLQIDRVMDLLGIRQGSTVADIGTGSGWFTVRAAQRVGSSGAVYAVDINQEYINHIKARAEKEGFSNIRPVLGKEDDPTLSANSVDSILILKTYHEFAKPINMLLAMRKAMRKDALLGIIDKNGEGDDHGLDAEKVIEEAERAGLALVSQHDFVKPDRMDYFLIFRKTAAP